MDLEPQIIEVEGQKYRSVTLDEWLMPLAPDHPARAELQGLRLKLADAMQTIDSLEQENSRLNSAIIKTQIQAQNRDEPAPDHSP